MCLSTWYYYGKFLSARLTTQRQDTNPLSCLTRSIPWHDHIAFIVWLIHIIERWSLSTNCFLWCKRYIWSIWRILFYKVLIVTEKYIIYPIDMALLIFNTFCKRLDSLILQNTSSLVMHIVQFILNLQPCIFSFDYLIVIFLFSFNVTNINL